MFAIAFHLTLFFSFLLTSVVWASLPMSKYAGGAVLSSSNNGTFVTNGLTITLPTDFTSYGAFNSFVAIDIIPSPECTSFFAVGFTCLMHLDEKNNRIQTYIPYYQIGLDDTLHPIEGVTMAPGQSIRMGVSAPCETPQTGCMLFLNEDTLHQNESFFHFGAGFCGRSAAWIMDTGDNNTPFPNLGTISFTNAAAFDKSGNVTYGPQSEGAVVTGLQIQNANGTTTFVNTTFNVDSLAFEYIGTF